MVQDLFSALLWYLALTGIGALALPISMRVFRAMPEGGILLSRPLGWLLLTYFSWILASLKILPFTTVSLSAVGLILLSVSVWLLSAHTTWSLRRLKHCWKTARNGEILTLLAFVLILYARRQDPAINTTEKPMDILFLNSPAVSKVIPPPDPWFLGKTINYHYGGYLLHAALIKLTGIKPEIAYNLAIATVAAMGTAIAFTLGRALFGRCRWAILSAVCALWIGNLASVIKVLENPILLKDLTAFRFEYLWNTSRVINDPPGPTINEYPFFSILWGDLHPHYTNLCFVLFFFALGYALFTAVQRPLHRRFWSYHWPLAGIAAISCGFLFPTNIFDYPVCSLLFAFWMTAALLRAMAKTPGQGAWPQIARRGAVIFLPLLGYLLVLPFRFQFVPPLQEHFVQISPHHSKLIEFLLIFGAHTVGVLGYLYLQGQAWMRKKSKEEIGFFLGLLGVVFVLVWGVTGYIVFAATPLITLALWAMVALECLQKKSKISDHSSEIFALILCAMAWSLITGCEIIFLKDDYGIPRMNTLFKFHFPAWLMLGIGLPYLLYAAIRRESNRQIRNIVLVPVLGVFLLSLIGPAYVFASLYWMPKEGRVITLDGLGFMKRDFPNLYEMIQWIRQNTDSQDAVLELPGCGYRLENTLSAFTGRPTVIGWVNHESLWHKQPPEANAQVYARKEEVLRFYSTQNWEEAKAFLKRYGIRYVAFTMPECEETVSKMTAMQQGAFRKYLQPVLVRKGNVYNASAPYELYRVPDAF